MAVEGVQQIRAQIITISLTVKVNYLSRHWKTLTGRSMVFVSRGLPWEAGDMGPVQKPYLMVVSPPIADKASRFWK